MNGPKQLWSWFWTGLPGDARSAVVGSAVAAVISIIWSIMISPGPPREVEINVNDQGFAKPMAALLGEVSKDPQPINVAFEPPELLDAWVCEYSHISGYSGREMMFSYLSKYSMCFSLVQMSENKYQVILNPNANPELKRAGGNWFCRCK